MIKGPEYAVLMEQLPADVTAIQQKKLVSYFS